MQSKLQKCNFCNINTYDFSINLLLLIICCFSSACNREKQTQQVLPIQNQITISESAINLNIASAEELEKLQHIGSKTAQNIIEHREKFGRFRRPEHLLLVRGISDNKFRDIRNSIKVE